MLITEIVDIVLAAAVLLMIFYIIIVVLRPLAAKVDGFFDRYTRKLGPERYLQFVSLPLYGAIVGGLISTAIAILVNPPPGNYHNSVYVAYALFASAIFAAALAPVVLDSSYANPKKWIIGIRIDLLKNGDWARDTKVDVIKTIEKDRAAIRKKLNNKGIWFLMLLALVIVSDIAWLILNHHVDRKWTTAETIVIAVILGGLVARYWVRRRYLQSALTYLDSYRAEADRLSPPSSMAPPSSATGNHHELWVAVGGLLVGAILAQSGAVRRRSERR
jgi:hypothetical protein